MSPLSATACWLVEPGRAELRHEVLAPPQPGQVQVRALHSAISRGTETLVFRGEVPPSEYQRMRAPFQVGDFPGPLKYGYSSVGVVEQGPADLLGRTVFCLYPHQSRYVVPADAVVPLPQGVPPGRAVLAAQLETAVNALWDAAPRIGDRVAVVGAGSVGLLVAWLAARLPGCTVQVIDTQPARRALAEHLGAGFCDARHGAGRRRPGGARQRPVRRAGHGAAPGRLRGDRARAQLVRHPRRDPAAGRSLPCAPPDADEFAGRPRRCRAAQPLDAPSPAGAGLVAAVRSRARCADHRHGGASAICPRCWRGWPRRPATPPCASASTIPIDGQEGCPCTASVFVTTS